MAWHHGARVNGVIIVGYGFPDDSLTCRICLLLGSASSSSSALGARRRARRRHVRVMRRAM